VSGNRTGDRVRFKLDPGRTEQGFRDSKPSYSERQARAEARRCIYCHDAPCTKACPAGIDVPGFVRKIASGNARGAARTIFRANVLGYSCARICPVEVLCVGACLLKLAPAPPVEIGRLQRFATESFVGASGWALKDFLPAAPLKPSGRKVALVGAGPASLACASRLLERGHEAVILEKRALPGGINLSGIAPYKIQAEDVLRETEWVLSSGIELRTGVEVGKHVSCEELLRQFDVVFLGVGLGPDSRLGIPDEDGPGVKGGVELIEKMKLEPGQGLKELLGRERVESVAVIGGGNTAIDAARELAQLGVRDVTILYRRTEKEMPGYSHELNHARTEGVRFVEKTVPLRILRDGNNVKGLLVARAEKARPVTGTEREFETQAVVVAIGQVGLSSFCSKFPGVRCDSGGRVVVEEETGRTGNPRVFAGGDCVNGGKEVVHAVADGKRAAEAMDEALR